MKAPIKKVFSVLGVLVLTIVAVGGATPFVASEMTRQSLLNDGLRTEGTLVQLKKIESEIFDLPGGPNAPNAPRRKQPQEQPIEAVKEGEPGSMMAGRVLYKVDGKEYNLIRTQLDYNARVGDTYEVVYPKDAPEHAIFADTPFPFGFLFTTLALVGVCIAVSYLALRYSFKQ